MKKIGVRSLTVCKVLVGVAIFVWLLYRINYADLIMAFKNIRIGFFLTGLMFFVLSMIFEVSKLFVLLSGSENLFRTAKIVYMGSFFNNFLPTNIGGDTYKIFVLGKTHGNWLKWSALVMADRGIGLSLLLIVTTILLIIYPIRLFIPFNSLFQVQMPALQKGFSLLAVCGLIFLVVSIWRWRKKLFVLCETIFQGLLNVKPWRYFMAIGSSALFHLARLGGIYFFLQALGSKTAAPEIMVTMALAAIVSVLPLSIGALGVREGAFAVGLGMYGVNFTTAIAIALLIRLTLWGQAMVGGIMFVFSKRKARE